MAELLTNQTSQLSATEVREFTGWDDPMIEDYLSLSAQVVQMTSEVIINIETTSNFNSSMGDVAARVRKLDREVADLYSIASQYKNQAKIRQIMGRLADEAANVSLILSQIGKIEANHRRSARSRQAQSLTRVFLGT
jgi:hypothetical protein